MTVSHRSSKPRCVRCRGSTALELHSQKKEWTVKASASLGVELGRLIPVDSYDEASRLAWIVLPDGGHRQLFGVGWTGMGWDIGHSANDLSPCTQGLFSF